MELNLDRLNELGFILEAAGSDEAVISLSVPDTRMLGLHQDQYFKQQVEISRHKLVSDPKTGEVENRKSTVKVAAVTPEINETTRKTFAYQVVVGVARQAWGKLMEGQSLQGRRMPDAPAPAQTEESLEEVSA